MRKFESCNYVKEGADAYKNGLGISDNPYVPGYSEPFELANKWYIGYNLEIIRDDGMYNSSVNDMAELAWNNAKDQEKVAEYIFYMWSVGKF